MKKKGHETKENRLEDDYQTPVLIEGENDSVILR